MKYRNIVLFECSRTISQPASFFTKKKKKSRIWTGKSPLTLLCEKLRYATVNISGEFITEEILSLYPCVHGWKINFN